jgi:very-short-patch-repair endonuclease
VVNFGKKGTCFFEILLTVYSAITHPAALRARPSSLPQAVKGVGDTFNIFILIFLMQTIIEFCRELRQRETPAEKILWHNLRNRQLFAHKFLRQYPVCVMSAVGENLYYIPDFYCHKAKLVIEADGPIHLLKKEYDKNRDEVLKALGLIILRFENDQILYDTASVLNKIKEHLIL